MAFKNGHQIGVPSLNSVFGIHPEVRILQSFKLREGATRVTGARMKDGLVGRLLVFVDFLFSGNEGRNIWESTKVELSKGIQGCFYLLIYEKHQPTCNICTIHGPYGLGRVQEVEIGKLPKLTSGFC